MAVEVEGKKQATLRQLFSKKVFSKKKPNAREDSLRPESMARASSSPSLNAALPRITRDSFSDFSKLVESRFQQISEERFFNMPSIKAHHHDTSSANPEPFDPAYDLDMSFSGFSAKKDDLSYLPPIDVGQRIRISIPALSPPTKAPSPAPAAADNKPAAAPIDVKKSLSLDSLLRKSDIPSTSETAKSDDETSFRYLQRGKDLSKRQMKTKHCPPPLKLSNSSFKTAKKATGHVVQVAVPVLIEPKSNAKPEPTAESNPSPEAKPSKPEDTEKKPNRMSKPAEKKPPSEKNKSRTSFPRKSRQSIYAKVRHSKQVARIAPAKPTPKQRESKTKALVVANPDCSDSETPSLSSKPGCPSTDDEEEVKHISQMKHASQWQEEDSTVQRFPLPPKQFSPMVTPQDISTMSIDSTAIHEALHAPPQKEVLAKLTGSPRSASSPSNPSPSEQIDFLLKKHTSTDLAEEGFDIPASVQLRYQAGTNDIKIETHKVDFRHVVGPAKASLRPLKPQFTLRKNASTQDLLTHTASLRERKPNPPVLSKKQSAARLIPTRKATESEIATISKIVAKSERTPPPRASPAPSNSLRTVLNHVRNLTRSNSTKASPLTNPTS